MSLSLYDVTREGQQIEEILMENDGELNPELEARLDALLSGGKDKLEAAAMVLRGLEASSIACEQELSRINARRVAFDRNAAHLKARMLAAVDAAFSGKVKTPLFTIYGQTSAPTVSFELAPDADLMKIPASLVRTTHALDKQLLQAIHKQGDPIPAEIKVTQNPGTRYLRVR